jgi:hypothetical protein
MSCAEKKSDEESAEASGFTSNSSAGFNLLL